MSAFLSFHLAHAPDMMRQAEERSRELKRSANDYCEDALRRTAGLHHPQSPEEQIPEDWPHTGPFP